MHLPFLAVAILTSSFFVRVVETHVCVTAVIQLVCSCSVPVPFPHVIVSLSIIALRKFMRVLYDCVIFVWRLYFARIRSGEERWNGNGGSNDDFHLHCRTSFNLLRIIRATAVAVRRSPLALSSGS